MFLLFSSICLFGSSLLLIFYHPVHTVLTLVVVASSITGLLLNLNAEFLGLLLAVVYIGAVVVLFLFCVFMISIRTAKKEKTPLSEGFAFFGLMLVFHLIVYVNFNPRDIDFNWAVLSLSLTNLENFNISLFTGCYNFSVVAAGLLLLISMVGAIFLTIQDYTTIHTTHVLSQISRVSSVYKT